VSVVAPILEHMGSSAPPEELAGAQSNGAGAGEPRWLTEVRLRAARRVLFMRMCWERPGYAEEQLLAISHSEVDRALEPPARMREQEELFYRSHQQASALGEAIAALADTPADARWERLAETLALTGAERALLALALAAAVDPRLQRVFGYLQDETVASGATPALAADLHPGLSRIAPGPDAPVLRWQLLHTREGQPRTAGASSVFDADNLLVRALLGSPGAEPGAGWDSGCRGTLLSPPADTLRAGELAEIVDFVRGVRSGADRGTRLELELVGPVVSGRRTLAARAAAALGERLVVLDAAALAAEADPAAALVREVRRALLQDTALALAGAEALRPELAHGPGADAIACCPLVFHCVEHAAAEPPPARTVRRTLTLAPLERRERLALWSSLADRPAPAPVADWLLRPGELAAAARVADAGEAAVGEVCRRLLTAAGSALVSQLPLAYGWGDLVLAPGTEAHLRELAATARDRGAVLDEWGFARLTPMGRGTTALLAGPSGTGKTMAAQVLARALGMDCVRVDLAGVVSKYIGETEKQLREVFAAYERAPALLFFDEADALFGKRTQVSDAHDRFANIEIDYLLQRMERFDGLAVLATNRKGDLDGAFVRRLRFIVDFAPPGVPERERLWRLCLEGAVDREGRPLVGELDYPALAQELDLTGAAIKSAALAAAHLARSEGSTIELRHVLAAGRRELEKQGLVVRRGRLEGTS
jgi:hypothetical protein